MTVACEDCKFWDKGFCHRYPTPVNTTKDYWCGEYESK